MKENKKPKHKQSPPLLNMTKIHSLTIAWLFPLFAFLSAGCSFQIPQNQSLVAAPFKTTKKIDYQGVTVDLVIDKPQGSELEVLMVFHGTVNYDSLVIKAAENSLEVFKNLLYAQDKMVVSVAYPEENLLFGDNLQHCEAALLWIQHNSESELGVIPKKIFLAGHSQGGYLAIRLNTLHATQGVVANGPGPLNLLYRCQLEENGLAPGTPQCRLLKNQFGTTTENPQAYKDRSLLSFTDGHTSDLLLVQGMKDSPIQLHSWPLFKEKMQEDSPSIHLEIYEVEEGGHSALFTSPGAKKQFNDFLAKR
jgi:acetyl esterase/lipase